MSYNGTTSVRSVSKCRHERRIKFDDKVNDFLIKMEEKGIPVSNLVNMLVGTCMPSFKDRGYTEEGIIDLWNNEKF